MGHTSWRHAVAALAAAVAMAVVLQATTVHGQQQVPGLAPEFDPANIVPNVTTDCPVPVTLYSSQEFNVGKLYSIFVPLLNSDPNSPCVQAAPQLLVCVLDNSIQARRGCCSTECAAQLRSYLINTGPNCYRRFLNQSCTTAIRDIQGPLFNAARRCVGLQPSCDLLRQPGTLLPPRDVLESTGGAASTTAGDGSAANTTTGSGGAANTTNNVTGALPAANSTVDGGGGGPSAALGVWGRRGGHTAATAAGAAVYASSRSSMGGHTSTGVGAETAYGLVREVSYARMESGMGLNSMMNASAVNGTGLNSTSANVTQGQQNATTVAGAPAQPKPAPQQQLPQIIHPQQSRQQPQQQAAEYGAVNERLAAALQEVVAREAAGPPPLTAALDAYNPEPEKDKVELVTPEELWPTAADPYGQG